MTEIPRLNDEKIIELAKSAAHSYTLSQEAFSHWSMDDYIDFYIEAFARAYRKIDQRLEMQSLGFRKLEGSEKLPNSPIR